MNIFAGSEKATEILETAVSLMQSDEYQEDAVRGPPAEGARFSKEANWVPNLTKNERDTVDYLVSKGRGAELTANSRIFFEQSKGKTLFGIYSTDDSTLLYASSGATAKKEHLFTEMIMEEYKNGNVANTSPKALHSWAKAFRLQQTSSAVDGGRNGVSGRSNRNDGIYGKQFEINASPALRSVLSNLLQEETERAAEGREVTGKASREYSYEWFTQKPDMAVTALNDKVPNNRADVVHKAKQNAAKIGEFNIKDGSVSVHVDDIDKDVVLGTAGLKHGLDRRFAEMAPVTLRAGEILKNSIKVNELTPEKQEADSTYVLIGVARSRTGDLQIVRSVINRYSNELTSIDVLYAINAKKGTAALNAPQDSTPGYRSTISIADLLEYVNEYFPDILPEDVLKHFGHDRRPDGNLGENVLYSREFVQGQLDQQQKQQAQATAALEKENGKLKEDNQYLRELVKLQKTLTNGTKFTRSSVIAAARMLKKKANVKHNANPAELVRLLEDFYGYIAKGDEITWESVMEAAQPAVGV